MGNHINNLNKFVNMSQVHGKAGGIKDDST